MNRRNYLRMLAGTGALTALAGCNSSEDESSSSLGSEPTDSPTENPTSAETSGSSTPTRTPTRTPTPEDQAPRLVTATATPQDNGEALGYQVVAEDDNGLQYVAVRYGDQAQEWEDLGRSIDETGQLTDLGQPPEEGQVAFIARDTAGQETREQRYPDQQAPTLAQFAAEPTENAGEIALTMQGGDDVGLEQLALLLDGNTQLQQNLSGQTETDTDTTVDVSDDATVGEKNTLTAALEDWNGNTTQTNSDTYVRKYDVMEDTKLDIGTYYMPFTGKTFQAPRECMSDLEAEPAIGEYGTSGYPSLISGDTLDKHIDQMQGHGINRVKLSFDGTAQDHEQIESLLDARLINNIEITTHYGIKSYRWNPEDGDPSPKDEIVPEDMGFIRENLLSRDNAHTHNGRPVVEFWNPNVFLGNEEMRQKTLEEYGDWSSFVDDIRSHLEVDGKEPYLIANTGGMGYEDAWEWRDFDEIITNFDATSTWVAGGARGEDNQATWDEAIDYVEQNYANTKEFSEEHGLDFVPTVFPGFDDRMNDCWGETRYTPRSVEGFQQLLELADEYRTTDMIDIATWNDWAEGSQIEPGTFRGNNYGTAYLEKVAEFQS